MKASYLTKAFPIALFSAIPSLSAQNVIFTDDMTDTFYTDFSFNGFDSGSNFDDVSSAYSENESSGGNPDGVLNIFHDHDVDRDEFGDPFGSPDTEIQAFFENGNFGYTPSTQGAINTLSFSLDVKTTDPIDSVFFILGDSNGSSLAQGLAGTGFLDITPNGAWQTITLSGLTESDFTSRDFSGNLTLDFGFGFTSFAEVSNGPETFFLQADNFQIEITPIPEPSSSLLIALGLAGLTRRRR